MYPPRVPETRGVMSIQKIVEQALQDGYLTSAMEAEVGRICDNASELSISIRRWINSWGRC